jgi:hypothetical protein
MAPFSSLYKEKYKLYFFFLKRIRRKKKILPFIFDIYIYLFIEQFTVVNIKLHTGRILSLIIGFFCIRSKEKFGTTHIYHTDKRVQRKPTIC